MQLLPLRTGTSLSGWGDALSTSPVAQQGQRSVVAEPVGSGILALSLPAHLALSHRLLI